MNLLDAIHRTTTIVWLVYLTFQYKDLLQKHLSQEEINESFTDFIRGGARDDRADVRIITTTKEKEEVETTTPLFEQNEAEVTQDDSTRNDDVAINKEKENKNENEMKREAEAFKPVFSPSFAIPRVADSLHDKNNNNKNNTLRRKTQSNEELFRMGANAFTSFEVIDTDIDYSTTCILVRNDEKTEQFQKEEQDRRDLLQLYDDDDDYSYYLYDLINSVENSIPTNNTTAQQSHQETQEKEKEIIKKINTFQMKLNVMTDAMPQETSWTLLPHNDSKSSESLIINSKGLSDTSTKLAKNALHEFHYQCTFSSAKTEIKETTSTTEAAVAADTPVCFEFNFKDSGYNGNCCYFGVGYFSLNVSIHNTTSTLLHDRLYASEISTLFCVNEKGELTTQEGEKEKQKKQIMQSHYLSRECINNECVCDGNPSLFAAYDERDSMYNNKMNVLVKMLSLSRSDTLLDVSSPQYKAACWVLNDDPFFVNLQQNVKEEEELNDDINTVKKHRIEARMIQRYILALFYFATSPKNWNNHFNFLSSKSECEWNTVDAFYNNNDNDDEYAYSFIRGNICDEDENVISIVFANNNLNGTIVEELYGLKSLEQLFLQKNQFLHGQIPSTLGRLPALRQLFLFDNSLDGTLAPELFHAKNINTLNLQRNFISGSIPSTIENLKSMVVLSLSENKLKGSIPDSIYSLTSLAGLELFENALTGSISSLLGDLVKLKWLVLNNNELTGSIPSTIQNLKLLRWLAMNSNKISGQPDTLSSLSSTINFIALHNNSQHGKMPDELCDNIVTSDCRNDVFDSQVICPCCTFCSDKSPIWEGNCADTKLEVEIDHQKRNSFERNSDFLKWSIIDHSTEKKVMYDGMYNKIAYSNDKRNHQTCIVNSGCFSLYMESAPVQDTNYSVSWNSFPIYSNTFPGRESIADQTQWFQSQSMISFYYDEEKNQIKFDDVPCQSIELFCGDNKDTPILIHPNTTERIIYSTALRISGTAALKNIFSPQSRALCWIVQDNSSPCKNNLDGNMDTTVNLFIQRYVLTILHLTSVNGLFHSNDDNNKNNNRDNEYPPLTHECIWPGIECSNNKSFVTKISLSSEINQMIGSTLIEELGNLAFLETFRLRQTGLKGPLPNVISNLYSLRELDLSMNALTGSIPDTFFHQLRKLEVLDLSYNLMTGTIPFGIGSHSNNMEVIQLSNNIFIGSLPLDGFKKFNLKFLDVSVNELSGSISPALLKHVNLEYLDISQNYFAGRIEKTMFLDLARLNHVDLSRNMLTGPIPKVRQTDESIIKHLDISINRFTGTFPKSISGMVSLEHLNLHGNMLTGRVPGSINSLKQLNFLALSHNLLKGSIPITFNKLSNVTQLYLHGNKFSGKAPESAKKLDVYITDCGFPSASEEPIECEDCSICCNLKNFCAPKPRIVIRPAMIAIIFLMLLIILMSLLYKSKGKIVETDRMTNYFEERAATWNASDIMGDKTVYHFFLTPNTRSWYIGAFCALAQLFTLFLFVRAADITNETSDLEYTMLCARNSLECDDDKHLSFYGAIIFILVLSVWLLRDVLASLKLFLLAMWKKDIDFFFASLIIFLVSIFSIWTSIFYNYAIASKDTELIVNAVILLFVNELDERLFQLVEACGISWVDEVDDSLRSIRYHEENSLIVSRTLHKVNKRFNCFFGFTKKSGDEESDDLSSEENIFLERIIESDETVVDSERSESSNRKEEMTQDTNKVVLEKEKKENDDPFRWWKDLFSKEKE